MLCFLVKLSSKFFSVRDFSMEVFLRGDVDFLTGIDFLVVFLFSADVLFEDEILLISLASK